jgi:uncharacterized lipoprotein YbaY
MTKMIRLALAAAFAASLAACAAQQPEADLTPPPKKCDAKTTLEYGKCR